MTNLIHRLMQAAKKFTLLDRVIVKIALIVFGLLLAKLFPILTSLHWAYYLALIAIAKLYFIHKVSQTK